ncbi:MAG: hypothetical protein JSS34_04235 [Proteobacteria bacterium]|nr:hypothetical protein [Pseudomonadota bacterium]
MNIIKYMILFLIMATGCVKYSHCMDDEDIGNLKAQARVNSLYQMFLEQYFHTSTIIAEPLRQGMDDESAHKLTEMLFVSGRTLNQKRLLVAKCLQFCSNNNLSSETRGPVLIGLGGGAEVYFNEEMLTYRVRAVSIFLSCLRSNFNAEFNRYQRTYLMTFFKMANELGPKWDNNRQCQIEAKMSLDEVQNAIAQMNSMATLRDYFGDMDLSD